MNTLSKLQQTKLLGLYADYSMGLIDTAEYLHAQDLVISSKILKHTGLNKILN